MVGSTVTVEETTIREILPEEATGLTGRGLVLQLDLRTETDAHASVRASLVADVREAGIFVRSASAEIREVAVRGVQGRKIDGNEGDGIEIVGAEAWPAAGDMTHVSIDDCARAGTLYYGATGTFSESVVRGSLIAVALEEGAGPTISDSNVYLGNDRNDVSSGLGLSPASSLEPLEP